MEKLTWRQSGRWGQTRYRGGEYNASHSWSFEKWISKLRNMENRFKIGCHESRKFSSSEIHYRFPYVSPDIIYLWIKNKPVFQFSKQEKQFKTSNYNMLKLKIITHTGTIHNILKPNKRNTNINVFVCKKMKK